MNKPEIAAAIREATTRFNAGDYARAEEIYRRVVASAPAAAHYADLSVICRRQGKQDEAAAFLERAVALEPKSAGFHARLGEARFRLGRMDEARESWRTAVTLEPRHADAWSWLGCLDIETGQLDEAVECLRRAIAADPRHYHAQDNLGIALRKQGRFEEAVRCHEEAIALKPGAPDAYAHLGTTYSDHDRLDDAIAQHQKALAADPSFSAAHCNLATAYVMALRVPEAIRSYRRALELEPGNASYHWNYSNALLLAGDFADGWAEYEWRWQARELRKRRPGYAGPEWRGEDPAGKTLLLYGEQGYGDIIQFARYAALLAERGANVLFAAPPELGRLVARANGVSGTLREGEPLPPFDFQAPVLSLPFLMKTRLDTVPCSVPYLTADPGLAESWRARLASRGGLRVGLIWGGRKTHAQDRLRSVALEACAALARIEGVTFYSLQKGEQGAQAKAPPAGMALIDWTGELADFADTAALMANLDLVISVDTAGAHLAGAMGRPVWLLNRHQTEWRWLLEREDSPWYPTMRIFRQPRPGDWPTVMERVAAALGSLPKRNGGNEEAR